VETCDSCGAEYFRDFDVENSGDEKEPYDDHCTGRRCEKPDCYHGQLSALHTRPHATHAWLPLLTPPFCGAILGDNIINFGEPLPRAALANAQKHSKKADVVIAIGTSLRVEPAASLVRGFI
jgi:NAD-dependent SIR2 family protein deacetylase